MPSGLIGYIGFDNPSFWSKIGLYLIAFPLANLFMLVAVEHFFNLLPDFQDAARQGKEIIVIREWRQQSWKIIGISYISMLSAGLLFKRIFGRKLEHR